VLRDQGADVRHRVGFKVYARYIVYKPQANQMRTHSIGHARSCEPQLTLKRTAWHKILARWAAMTWHSFGSAPAAQQRSSSV